MTTYRLKVQSCHAVKKVQALEYSPNAVAEEVDTGRKVSDLLILESFIKMDCASRILTVSFERRNNKLFALLRLMLSVLFAADFIACGELERRLLAKAAENLYQLN